MDLKKDPKKFQEFLNNLEVYYNNQRGFSKTLLKWAKDSELYSWVVDISKIQDLGYYPADINDIINIIKALQDAEQPYYISEMVLDARLIWDLFKADIFNYMNTLPPKPVKLITEEQAILEFKARGFISLNSARIRIDKPYIRCIIRSTDLVFPRQWGNVVHSAYGGIYERLGRIGIRGYTGIYFPKK